MQRAPARRPAWLRPSSIAPSAPQVPEVPEGELLAEVRQVVRDVDDEHFLLAAVQRSSEATSDHLLVDIRAEGRTRDVDGVDLGHVEAFGEDVVVRQDPNALRL